MQALCQLSYSPKVSLDVGRPENDLSPRRPLCQLSYSPKVSLDVGRPENDLSPRRPLCQLSYSPGGVAMCPTQAYRPLRCSQETTGPATPVTASASISMSMSG